VVHSIIDKPLAKLYHKNSMDIIGFQRRCTSLLGLSLLGLFSLMGGLVSSLLLLEELREELLIGTSGLSGSLPGGDLARLVKSLASVSLLSDESLNLGRLVVGLLTRLHFSPDNILGDIVLLTEGESLSNLTNSLGSESSRSLSISESGNIVVTLLEDLEGNDAEIGSADAASDGLSLSLTISSGSVRLGSRAKEDSGTAVNHDTLFHGESLLVVASGDSEGVALELLTNDGAVNIRAHSSVVEVAIDLIIINFFYDLLPSNWVRDVVFHSVSGIMIGSTAG